MSCLYLVSCVGLKAAGPMPARELYVSPWFQKARRHVERKNAEWRILSAKYGLIHPNTVIEPYDTTLNTMHVVERKAWARRVTSDLTPLLSEGDTVIMLAGQRYREFIEPELRRRSIIVEVPMREMRIGRQLQWFDQEALQSIV